MGGLFGSSACAAVVIVAAIVAMGVLRGQALLQMLSTVRVYPSWAGFTADQTKDKARTGRTCTTTGFVVRLLETSNQKRQR